MTDALPNFDAYWRRYVAVHADPRVRRVQFVSTSVGIGIAACGVLTRRLSLIAAASAFAFVPTFVARVAWGQTTESIRERPLFRVAAALKAWKMTVQGTMQAEVDRVMQGTPPPPEDDSRDAPIPRPNMVTDHTLH
jgi:hypothetical protein